MGAWILVQELGDRQQALVPGEPIQKIKRVQMDENPLCSRQLKSIESKSFIPFQYDIWFSAAAAIHEDICVHCANLMCVFLPVCGVQGHALEVFFLSDLRLQAL